MVSKICVMSIKRICVFIYDVCNLRFDLVLIEKIVDFDWIKVILVFGVILMVRNYSIECL